MIPTDFEGLKKIMDELAPPGSDAMVVSPRLLKQLLVATKRDDLVDVFGCVKGDSPLTFSGLRIIESPLLPEVPAVEIDPKFPWITKEGRARINARFLEMFGTKEVGYIFSDQQINSMLREKSTAIDRMINMALMGDWLPYL